MNMYLHMKDLYANSVFAVLMLREFRRIGNLAWQALLDGASVITTQAIFFESLFPLLGVPVRYTASLYLGANMSLIFWVGYWYCLNLGADLKEPRLIDYQLMLPVSLKNLLATYVISFVLQIGAILVPLCFGGFFLLSNRPPLTFFSLLQALGILFLGVTFIGTFFVTLAFLCNMEWLKANGTIRLLVPIALFNANFVIWHDIYAFSKPIGYVLACNPITYISEGMRNSLLNLNPTQQIPTSFCALVLLGSIILMSQLLVYGARRRLDPV